jgi:hypothetical protein
VGSSDRSFDIVLLEKRAPTALRGLIFQNKDEGCQKEVMMSNKAESVSVIVESSCASDGFWFYSKIQAFRLGNELETSDWFINLNRISRSDRVRFLLFSRSAVAAAFR